MSPWFAKVQNLVEQHQYWMLASVMLIGIVSAVRWLVPKLNNRIGAWLKTDHGAITLVIATSVLGAFGNAFAAGTRPTWTTLGVAVKTAGLACLAYPPLRKLVSGYLGIDLDQILTPGSTTVTSIVQTTVVDPAPATPPATPPEPPKAA